MLPFALVLALATPAVHADTTPIECDNCAEWNQPHAPFRLIGNSYYVGVDGLSSVLIVGKQGHVLIDGALPQSAERIAANIRTLGFRVEDVKWIVNSHAHYDHAGGIAALQRLSGAQVAASVLGAATLRAGTADDADPQHGYGDAMRFPPVAKVRELRDGEVLALGELRITAHYTPGHTSGGDTWTWRSCEGKVCRNLVYADSLTPVSAPGFRYTADGGARIAQFRRSIATVRALPCDVLISAHPGLSNLFDKQQARDRRGKKNALIDPNACRAYADDAEARLGKRIAEERAQAPADR
ncbi:subclass B3 metallo-beta-lactamase [Arenimonas oryziterrae]|uniref:Metallo-beta-lactamase domain-containing protein n=1 Tax=Arenimonas oryziterrae DSM 21050 = YC6267 TaxID=1121015 RepID=A0A091AT68_9GAMM|nr:subclass B3 metallo-beta-lactamase [Arenimonas oryziterrae]KFN42531.1 hypothetical protein N789_12895 [Arenimonas oryziterrae DSM 21050 = YC6267]